MGGGNERPRDKGTGTGTGTGRGKKKCALGMALQKDMDDTNKEHGVMEHGPCSSSTVMC